MNFRFAAALAISPLLAFAAIGDPAQCLSQSEQGEIVGGACPPTAFAEGKFGTGTDACSVCATISLCDVKQTQTLCVDLESGDNPFSKCGTCTEDCGGTRKTYTEIGCKGSWTTSACTATYTTARLDNGDAPEEEEE